MKSTLPREEWDFSSVPANELDACFWWEYARSSTGVVNAVAAMSGGKSSLSWALNTKAADILTPSFLLSLAASRGLCARWPFPSVPWQVARDFRLSKDRSRTFGAWWCDTLAHLSSKPVRWHTGRILCTKDEVALVGDGVFEVVMPVLGGSKRTRGDTRSSMLITVDWRFSVDQIAEAFKDAISATWPPQHPRPRSAIIVSPAGLPERNRRREALGWLGIWRLKQSSGSWSEFERRYYSEPLIRGKKSDDFLRTKKRQHKQATALLRRFDGRGKR